MSKGRIVGVLPAEGGPFRVFEDRCTQRLLNELARRLQGLECKMTVSKDVKLVWDLQDDPSPAPKLTPKRGRPPLLSEEDKTEIRRMFSVKEKPWTVRAIARSFNTSVTTVNKVLNGSVE